MSGFVKIYGSILDSSIWSESLATRVVWIAMLAMAEKDGVVRASSDGIARRANVSLKQVDAALESLQAPDPRSKSSEHDGRRVQRTEEGWLILNYEKYRELRTDKQIADAERLRRLREEGAYDSRGPVAGNATRSNVAPEAEAEADAEKEGAVGGAVVGVVMSDTAQAALQITAAANRAARQKWNTEPWVQGATPSYTLADEVLSAGIPIPDAIQRITDQINASGLPRAPRSIRYFLPGILEPKATGESTARPPGQALTKPDADANAAFASAQDILAKYGDLRFVPAEVLTALYADDRTKRGLKAIGGLIAIRQCAVDKLTWLKRDFAAAFNSAAA